MPTLLSLVRRTTFVLILSLSFASLASAGEYLGTFCLDIQDGNSSVRLFKLEVTQISDEQFLVNGTRADQTTQMPGAAVGSAALLEDGVTITVNSSQTTTTGMSQSTYQIQLGLPTLAGNYQAFTQVYNGRFSPLLYSTGDAVLLDCALPITNFGQ